MTLRTAIGLMSGTSMDGIDIALLKTDGQRQIERGPNDFFAYDPETISKITIALEDAVQCNKSSDRPGILGEVERLITDLHGEAVKRFLKLNSISSSEIDVVGFHGQTVLHRPEKGFTIQLGDGDGLAKSVGIDCVYDLRANDMKHGGQGAPLVPVYHQALASNLSNCEPGQSLAFVNIGGISNISFVGTELVAFDCGPGNALIDQWVQAHAGIPFDQGGMIAAEGNVLPLLAERYMSNPYFERGLPKSLDRNDFLPPDVASGSVEDVARTLAFVTADAIIRAQDHLNAKPHLWIICGGGRLNPYIMRDLSSIAEAHFARVATAEEFGLDGDAMEAECWAYLAVRSLEDLPITFPTTTGVNKPVSGGKLARA